MKTEALFDGTLDLPRQQTEVAALGPEQDIAAIDEGLRVPQVERLVERAELAHLNLAVPAQVDAAKHRNDHGHVRKVRSRILKPLPHGRGSDRSRERER